MKALSKLWNFLIEWSVEIEKHRKQNPRINAWY